MTVQTSTSTASFAGNGVTTVFPLGFKFNAATDLVVLAINDASGASANLTLNSDYTVSGAGNDAGGSITTTLPPDAGVTIKVARVLDVLQLTDLRNQGGFFAEVHEDAFDLLTMFAQQNAADSSQAIRVAVGDPTPARLPRAISRALHYFAFDADGNPVAVPPVSGDIGDYAMDLLDSSDINKGAALVGMAGKTLYDYIKDTETALTIEHFGPVDTPANTRVTMQTAIDYCAANGLLLRAKAPEFTIDVSAVSITIPDNFRCDLGNAWIKRATGNATPHDMWVNADTVNGNTGLDIRNVRFDGQYQADSLDNYTVAHRFCGLRLVKCSGYLENVRADNTVNAEIQPDGTRGAIMLDQSVDMRAFRLFADGNDGSGVFPCQGKNYILGVWTKDNTGSGFTSYGCDDNDFHHIYSDGSGYSGVSVNGVGMRCSMLSGTGAAVGYSGVNIGHDAAGNRADASLISGVYADSNNGYGVTVVGSTGAQITGLFATNNAVRNFWVSNSPILRVKQAYTRGALSEDVRIDSAGEHWLEGDFRGSPNSGITALNGAIVHMGPDSIVANCGSAGGSTAALLANAGSSIIYRGTVASNARYGAIANGAGALVDVRGALFTGNALGNFLSVSGGTLRYEAVRTSSDPMSGTLTILSGTSSVVVNNGNALLPEQIMVMPSDAVAAGAGPCRISAIVPGVSFTVAVNAAVGSNAAFRYKIL